MTQSYNEQAPSTGRLFLFSPHFWIPVAIMFVTAIIFNLFDLDLRIQSYYYQDGWRLDHLWWVRLLYRYANIPALLISVGALMLYLYSYRQQSSYLKYRKMALFLSLAMIIGPGIIVNSIFKDNWGRPRPREIELYGGRYAYEAPLNIDPESPGKSFPCGHATVGFYFFAPALLFAIKKRQFYFFITCFAIVFGTVIGWVRVIQGGHFVSDVIFAGGMVYLSSYVLWKLMKLDVQPYHQVRHRHARLKKWQLALVILGIIFLILGVSLATPYTTKQGLSTLTDGDYKLHITLSKANVELSFSDSLYVSNNVYAFGFPGSKARLKRAQIDDLLSFEQQRKGYFSEFSADIQIVIDTLRTQQLNLILNQGDLHLDLPAALASEVHCSTVGDSLISRPRPPDSVVAKYQISAENIISADAE
jgi:lipid A 4'-phosphatase